MICHDDFGKLRLAQFLPGAELQRLRNWEYEERLWVGEALGFSQWLRLESDRGVLRCLSIAFNDFPSDAAVDVLKTLQLPLRPGMTLPAIRKVLGEPVKAEEQLAALERICLVPCAELGDLERAIAARRGAATR